MAKRAYVIDPPRLREARERAGLTQAKLAAEVGVAKSLIEHLEAGRRQGSPATIKALADFLRVEFDAITRQPGQPEPAKAAS